MARRTKLNLPIQRRLWVDMTHTLHSGLNTGIQRVVRKLAENLPEIANSSQTQFCTVVFRDGCFQRVASQTGVAAMDYRRFRRDFSNSLPAWYKSIIQKWFPNYPFGSVQRFLLPKPGKLGIFFLPSVLFFSLVTSVRWLTRPLRRIRFQPEDVLLLPDGYWVVKRIWPGVSRAQAEGAKIVFVVYDLICLTHPQFFMEGSKDRFERYLREVGDKADLILAISNTVAMELQAKLSEMHSVRGVPDIRSFALGADIDSASLPVRESLVQLLKEPFPTFLVASTIEPRKNHRVVLDAFDRLWKETNARLFLVGRLGWLHAELLNRLQTSSQFNKRLFHFCDLNDTELAVCYQRCAGVICPSHAEGFGLPISEALWHGQTVFVSDIPIHREVGQGDCVYFRKDEPSELASRIICYLGNRESKTGSISRNRSVLSWKESTRGLFDAIMEHQQVPIA